MATKISGSSARTDRVLTQSLDWQAPLEQNDLADPDPPPDVEARMDAGFSSGQNLTWLLEMGSCPNTKAPNGQTAIALCSLRS
ncbi:MAG: hypothetical protein JXB85_18185 [Anaerolineales bacterium]|nr:hypothetical protein [Anaerolineales bacterium]